jgi:hypothetical protein
MAGLLIASVRYANRRRGLLRHVFQGRSKSPAVLIGEDSREPINRQGEWAIGDAELCHQARNEQGRPAPRRRGRPSRLIFPLAALSDRLASRPHEPVVFLHQGSERSGCVGSEIEVLVEYLYVREEHTDRSP